MRPVWARLAGAISLTTGGQPLQIVKQRNINSSSAVIYNVVGVLAGGGKGGAEVMSGGKPACQNGGK